MKCIKCGYEILEQDNERMNKCPVCDTDFLDTYAYIYLKNSSDIKTQNEAFRRIYRNTSRRYSYEKRNSNQILYRLKSITSIDLLHKYIVGVVSADGFHL